LGNPYSRLKITRIFLIDIAVNTNVELQIKSSDFQLPSIDIVSKYLWWTYLNPENTDQNRAEFIEPAL
jgi:hypothetical protein